jgi:hypothetical protein
MLVGRAPDFRVTSISAPSTVPPAQPFSTTVTVCNRGTMPGSAPVALVMSADNYLGIGPGQLDVPAGQAVVSLDPGRCSAVVINSVPVGLGAMFVGAVIDDERAVVELSDTNNVSAARSITVR